MPDILRNHSLTASRHTIAWPAWYVNKSRVFSKRSSSTRPFSFIPSVAYVAVDESLLKTLLVDQALQLHPLRRVRCRRRRAVVVRIVDMLNHRLAGVQHVGVRHVRSE